MSADGISAFPSFSLSQTGLFTPSVYIGGYLIWYLPPTYIVHRPPTEARRGTQVPASKDFAQDYHLCVFAALAAPCLPSTWAPAKQPRVQPSAPRSRPIKTRTTKRSYTGSRGTWPCSSGYLSQQQRLSPSAAFKDLNSSLGLQQPGQRPLGPAGGRLNSENSVQALFNHSSSCGYTLGNYWSSSWTSSCPERCPDAQAADPFVHFLEPN